MATRQQFRVGTEIEFWFRGTEFVSRAAVVAQDGDNVIIRLIAPVNPVDTIRNYDPGREITIQDRAWRGGRSLRPTSATQYVVVEVEEPQYSADEPF